MQPVGGLGFRGMKGWFSGARGARWELRVRAEAVLGCTQLARHLLEQPWGGGPPDGLSQAERETLEQQLYVDLARYTADIKPVRLLVCVLDCPGTARTAPHRCAPRVAA